MFDIGDILKATGGSLQFTVYGSQDKRPISGVSIDSRTIKKDEIFVAIKGKKFDGHEFVREAVKKGAAGAVVDRDIEKTPRRIAVIRVGETIKALGDIARFHRSRFDIPVIGITGSNGKTTVKEMFSFILQKRYNILKSKGTENNHIGVPLTLLRLRKVHSAVVIEMGANHHGEIDRLAEIVKPAIGLITNIGSSHLEFFKDELGVLKAKSELVRKLPREGVVILNGDDKLLLRIKPRCKKITFGFRAGNDYRATDIKIDNKTSFLLNNTYRFKLKTLGWHNLYNALAAIAAARHMGVAMLDVKNALLNFKVPSMRTEFKTIRGINIIDDAYNSNPLSLKCAIDALSKLKTRGRRILVSGDMLELGDKSRLLHTLAGRLIAGSSIDTFIGVGKFSQFAVDAAGSAGMARCRLWLCPGVKEASGVLRSIARRGDAVLVKGSRGMRMERIIESL